MNPTTRLRKHLNSLQDIREDLMKLYSEATLDRNKSAVLYIELEVAHAIGKMKKFLKIPLDKDEKKKAKIDSSTYPSPFREEE